MRMLTSNAWEAPKDYKVYCFGGIVKYVMVCIGRGCGINGRAKYYFFDENWKLARIDRDSFEAPEGFSVKKPVVYDKMIQCAEKLAKPFPFVRVDFFVCKNKLYFGELTFTPDRNLDTDIFPETDMMFGNLTLLKR